MGVVWQKSYMFYPLLLDITDMHYDDIIMGAMASQITNLTIVYSTIYSDADQRKHQSSASLAFVLGIHRGPVNSPHKWPVTRKMFPFDDVIMAWCTVVPTFHACTSSWNIATTRWQTWSRLWIRTCSRPLKVQQKLRGVLAPQSTQGMTASKYCPRLYDIKQR